MPTYREVGLTVKMSPDDIRVIYTAASDVDEDIMRAVLRNSMYRNWDPVARAEALEGKKSTDIEDDRPKAYEGPLLEGLTKPRVTEDREDDTVWLGLTYFPRPCDTTKIVAQTIHGVTRHANGTITYELEEVFSGDGIATRVRDQVMQTPNPHLDHLNEWEAKLLKSVKQMGDAILERCITVYESERRKVARQQAAQLSNAT
ncbi:hypothetical protein NM688_g9115 [Phlebia brevispora]|uniref:Uncharacterized protein n=1 Tax=Phlebia brevispora TaxID=194682 RepID=A0ACC1RL71_9APHY|nr:hypothetical protein NM688_g9115 [Phlebia brevispora]